LEENFLMKQKLRSTLVMMSLLLVISLIAAQCGAAAPTEAPKEPAAAAPATEAPAEEPAAEVPATEAPAAEEPAAMEKLAGDILVDGSSTVYPITEAMAEEFGKLHPDTRVTVGISGTGGGFKKFCAGETDISDASRPIKPSEAEACAANNIEYIELPVAYDGLAVMINPENDWAETMTVEELKMLWEPAAQGKIMRWNQIRPDWPDEEIHLYGAGTDSGTYDYFTQAIVGEEGSSRGDFQASEDDNVLVQGIAGDPLALGFFGVAYYQENKDILKLVAIDDEDPTNGDGPILPSEETVNNGTYQPLARPIFIYVRQEAAERPEVDGFIDFYLNPENATTLVREVGYIPLPTNIIELAKTRFDDRVYGSIYGGEGSQVGVTLEDLLQAEQ
jgi:phosphate transport system substrate-binding protein